MLRRSLLARVPRKSTPRTPKATKKAAEAALSAEVIELLSDPNVIAWLRSVASGTREKPTAGARKTTADKYPESFDLEGLLADVLQRPGHKDQPASSVGGQTSVDTFDLSHLRGVRDAVDAGMSPWTAPFDFKPPYNVRGGAPFASHNRRVLEGLSGTWNGAAPEFPVRWVNQATAAAFGFQAPSEKQVRLPSLPAPCEVPSRQFAPMTALDASAAEALCPDDPPIGARCGLSGKFFSREEVVDALLCEAARRRFTSSFWIQPDHPRLTSGYLELKAEEKPTIVQVAALTFPATRIPTDVAGAALFSAEWANPSTRKPGMNVFTGKVSTNRDLREGDYASGWASLDQLIEARIQIPKSEASQAQVSFAGAGLDGGKFVCLHEFALYNADQLEKPGRLGLIREEERRSQSLFQPLFG